MTKWCYNVQFSDANLTSFVPGVLKKRLINECFSRAVFVFVFFNCFAPKKEIIVLSDTFIITILPKIIIT